MCIRVIRGGNGLADGPVKPEVLDQVMKKVAQLGFAHKPQVGSRFVVFYNISVGFQNISNSL